MLSQSTQALIGDVFQRDDLFEGLPRIENRIVAWGPNSKPVALPHSSVLVSEQDLSARLLPGPLSDGQERDAEAEWIVLASRPLPPSAIEHHFGTRIAVALAVEMKDESDASACWIESLEAGWLFLTPGWLLAVGGTPESLLAQSRVVAAQIHEPRSTPREFPAYPRIADPLCGPGWLACGTAALAFDPLCGDGVGNAIREAILAAAVLRAIAEGANIDSVLAHYRGRLLAGFTRHLELCRQFYVAGNSGPWWDAGVGSHLERNRVVRASDGKRRSGSDTGLTDLNSRRFPTRRAARAGVPRRPVLNKRFDKNSSPDPHRRARRSPSYSPPQS